jgi:hypothetical protein
MTFLERLQRAYPFESYANTLRALREGIAAADDTIKGIPMLAGGVGDDYRGLMRRAGIFHRIAEMCKAGDLPFRAELTPMPRGTWHWLDIFSGDAHGHIVRTEEPSAFPEDTPNRQDQRARNTRDLFEDKRVVRLESVKLYSWLCYRATPDGALFHALWQAPSAKVDGKPDEWLARINLLNVTVIKKSDDLQRPAKVDPKTKMKLRETAQNFIKKKNEGEQGA